MTATATINTTAKSQLAKLLATENISIEYNPSAKTASFDVKNRVLYMPVWQNISEDLHDMLTVHETGHAIDTPESGWTDALKVIAKKYFGADDLRYQLAIKSYLNVVEDARIDKRQKRRYPGSRHNYLAGYKELINRDFFGTKNIDINGLTFIDRANLYFKGGNLLLKINFTPEERKYLKRMEDTETWEQVVELTDELFGLAKSKKDQQDAEDASDDENDDDLSVSVSDDDSYGDIEGDAGDGNNSGFDEDLGGTTSYGSEGGYGEGHVPESMTDKTYEERKQEIVSANENKFAYFKLPKMDYAKIVDDYPKFLADCRAYYVPANLQRFEKDWLETQRQSFNDFKRDENNTISYMVKEFEMRKAADMYSRISIAKTGVIDTNKLHSYKHNDDIFRRLATLPKGKNHGFVMFLDWSSSMHSNLSYTMKQLFSLTMFCKRVQIPFEVYLFRDLTSIETGFVPRQVEKTPGYISFTEFKLRNVLSSRMKVKDLMDAYNYLWNMARDNSPHDGMSGTPLNQTIYVADKIVNDFKARNKLQVVNTIFLTDGDSNQPFFGEQSFMNTRQINIIKDDVTKKDYRISIDNGYQFYTETGRNVTRVFLEILKSRTNCNLLGFFLYDQKFKHFTRRFDIGDNPEYVKKMQKHWDDNGFVPVTSEGYDEYYVIDTLKNHKKKYSQLEVDSSMTRNKIAKNFMKFSQKKAVNRILLNRFMEKVTKNG